jgi:hypothetical protein
MDLYIKGVVASGSSSRSTAKLMKTGQTTSYRTGDDGDLEAGRNVDFTTLAENNVFGNTNRFTDELGGQTYTKDIVIDWSTYDGAKVLGWRRTTNGTNVQWNTAIDGALAVTIAPFTSGWRLPNNYELFSISNVSFGNSLNYSPFNVNPVFNTLWTSNTWAQNAGNGFILNQSNAAILLQGKTSVSSYLPCRTFTVTGTTLS